MGNYDQEFIIYGQEFINFYSKLKQFSLNLMKEIVTFSKKPLQEATKSIIEAQATLGVLTEKMNMIITGLPRTKLLCITVLRMRKFITRTVFIKSLYYVFGQCSLSISYEQISKLFESMTILRKLLAF